MVIPYHNGGSRGGGLAGTLFLRNKFQKKVYITILCCVSLCVHDCPFLVTESLLIPGFCLFFDFVVILMKCATLIFKGSVHADDSLSGSWISNIVFASNPLRGDDDVSAFDFSLQIVQQFRKHRILRFSACPAIVESLIVHEGSNRCPFPRKVQAMSNS